MMIAMAGCHDCKGDKRIVRCVVHNPKDARICKDCCIGKMNGHGCKWFGICWEMHKAHF
ncbi:MAG: hypothetical protein HY518_03945 [Candidatus Aenigmarchaeota archaeon]|nr:hypothetical protein [Candidatus Aenigmarchaeota archaeon]